MNDPQLNAGLFQLPARKTPGLFITGTDTGVGKTIVTCAIAEFLVRVGLRVGVCKPFASGCRSERGSLVSDDAEALAHYAQLDPLVGGLPLVTPLVYRDPVAPAIAMAMNGTNLDTAPIARSMKSLDEGCDVVLIEGIGGVMVPLDPHRPSLTLIDLIREMGYPVVIVTRADVGTLNHTALTVNALRSENARVAGLIVNSYEPDSPDPAMQTNTDWLAKMNRVPILATLPRMRADEVAVSEGRLHEDIRAAITTCDWRTVIRPPMMPR